ncbi:MAG TPA: HEPN domain-containing protein [Sedimentisphaerales bacterium]|nr:HEPN domain-containing protein [Sedimentisphaerales bacterium]HRS09827.1 HEPN domain-containing protein [Sedimentisphaerales bacterium]HRV46523.1 HEPN domain-containing protein [Sedimentisphaerales bacterium]
MTAPDDHPSDTAQQWLRHAEGDLAVAEHEMARPNPIYHTVCFLCQSAAEKFVKGFLISRGWSLEKTHDHARSSRPVAAARAGARARFNMIIVPASRPDCKAKCGRRNPKHETRNSKQIPRTEIPMPQTANCRSGLRPHEIRDTRYEIRR